MSIYGINTYAYTQSHTAQACLEDWARRGHTDFEVMMYPGHAWPADMDAGARHQFKRFLADAGLRITTLNMPNVDINVAGATSQMRTYSLAVLRGIVRLAGELEVPGVVLGPGKPNPLFPMAQDKMTDHFFAALDVLAPLAEQCGTALWVENMPFAFLPQADQMMAAIERYGDPRIGVVYDIANAYFVREDLGAGLERVRDRLKLVHLSDTPLDAYRHAAIGEGTIDFASVPPLLDAVDYDGPAMLEIISDRPDTDLPASIEALDAAGFAQ